MSNRLDSRLHRKVPDATTDRRGCNEFWDLWHSEHRELLNEWAALNGIKRTREFWLSSLVDGKRRYTADGYHNPAGRAWPWKDHDSYYQRDRRPAAIVSQPYGSDDAELRAVVERLGLVLHTPPNLRASFWYPGSTAFIVITSPTFGTVQWLPDQLEFELNEKQAT